MKGTVWRKGLKKEESTRAKLEIGGARWHEHAAQYWGPRWGGVGDFWGLPQAGPGLPGGGEHGLYFVATLSCGTLVRSVGWGEKCWRPGGQEADGCGRCRSPSEAGGRVAKSRLGWGCGESGRRTLVARLLLRFESPGTCHCPGLASTVWASCASAGARPPLAEP